MKRHLFAAAALAVLAVAPTADAVGTRTFLLDTLDDLKGGDLTGVSVDWGTWTVRIDAKGIAAEGRLEDIGSYHRRIVGTWTQGGTKGDFKLTRD